MKLVGLLMLSPMLTACFHWVDNSYGGSAERYPTEQITQSPLQVANSRELKVCQVVMTELDSTDAMKQYPAQTSNMRLLWIRAQREHSAELNADAKRTLAKLRTKIKSVQEKMKGPQLITVAQGGAL